MIDIHSHIIYNVDDGCKTVSESIELIRILSELGFKELILTPHYISDEMCENKINNFKKLDELSDLIEKENIDVKLYLGNELFICNNIESLVRNNDLSTLNNTKYILIELPFYTEINNLDDILYELKYQGFRPIIAHPERYTYFQKNHKLIEKLRDDGILFQCNYASILGYYGHGAKNLMKYMLKNKMVTCLATDMHYFNRNYIYDNFSKMKSKIISLIGEVEYNKFNDNNKCILLDKDM